MWEKKYFASFQPLYILQQLLTKRDGVKFCILYSRHLGEAESYILDLRRAVYHHSAVTDSCHGVGDVLTSSFAHYFMPNPIPLWEAAGAQLQQSTGLTGKPSQALFSGTIAQSPFKMFGINDLFTLEVNTSGFWNINQTTYHQGKVKKSVINPDSVLHTEGFGSVQLFILISAGFCLPVPISCSDAAKPPPHLIINKNKSYHVTSFPFSLPNNPMRQTGREV